MVKNLPGNAGDIDSIPDQGTKIPDVLEQLSPRTTTSDRRCHNWRVGAPKQKISRDSGKITSATTKTSRSQINR